MRQTVVRLAMVAIGGSLIVESAQAQFGVGSWIQKSVNGKPGVMTMTVEACCNGGRRLIYRAINGNDLVMTVESPFDGTEVQIKTPGPPTNSTMAITRIDDH